MELLQHITEKTTVLTPNRRLSANFLKQYHTHQVTLKKTSWFTADILPFTSWVQRLWKNYTATHASGHPLLIPLRFEQILWEEIIKKSPAGEFLLELSSSAELARKAWELLKQWQIPLLHPEIILTPDGQVFQEWALAFQEQLQLNHWLDNSSLLDKLCEQIPQSTLDLPETLILIGFTEWSPQQHAFLKACENQHINIIHYEKPNINISKQRIQLADQATEIQRMARWAKHTLKTSTSKTPSIACIVPNLDKIRDQVVSIFLEVFQAEKRTLIPLNELPFNISAGKSLASYPVIRSALQWLKLATQTLSLNQISKLLRSPFLGEAEQEHFKRAVCDRLLREKNISSITLKDLLNDTFKQVFIPLCPKLFKRLQNYYRDFLPLTSIKHSMSDWATHFLGLLTQIGWPGERSLNSVEYQVVQSWLELLNQMQQMNSFLRPQTYTNALHYLSQLSDNTMFQPQSPAAPIQILGLLEAADLPFDAAWVMGLDDITWPPAPKPNPFIPQRLQKKFNMPHATPERELSYSSKLTTQIEHSAKHIIFSHAKFAGDCELRPSALIACLPEMTDLLQNDDASLPEQIYTSRLLETMIDEKAPLLKNQEKVRGGATIFQNQAACPFKAFAENRLQAVPLEHPSAGLNKQARGKIIHKALELIWKNLQNSATLQNMPENNLRDLIQKSAGESIQAFSNYLPAALRYLQLETVRLETLLWNWLQIEKTRPHFKVVSLEQESTLTLQDFTFTLRIDRIDELEDGRQIIIDYKTGKINHIKSWFSERLDAPQLPLYCVMNSENSVGISFAQVHPEALSLHGISKDQLSITSIKTLSQIKYTPHNDWEIQVQTWRASLEQMATEFREGNASVNPKDHLETCQYCELKPLCRIHEMSDS